MRFLVVIKEVSKPVDDQPKEVKDLLKAHGVVICDEEPSLKEFTFNASNYSEANDFLLTLEKYGYQFKEKHFTELDSDSFMLEKFLNKVTELISNQGVGYVYFPGLNDKNSKTHEELKEIMDHAFSASRYLSLNTEVKDLPYYSTEDNIEFREFFHEGASRQVKELFYALIEFYDFNMDNFFDSLKGDIPFDSQQPNINNLKYKPFLDYDKKNEEGLLTELKIMIDNLPNELLKRNKKLCDMVHPDVMFQLEFFYSDVWLTKQ